MNRKKTLKRVTLGSMASVLALSTMLSGCGGSESEKVIIDFGSLMPTQNETVTAENPEVIQASKHIIEAYEKEHGIEIEWASEYARDPSSDVAGMTSWYNQQVTTNNCPIIGFTSLNSLQSLDYYVTLDEYLERPNPYANNVKWKDMFRDYVWEDSTLYNIKGEIVAIPILLSAGAQTGIYYNQSIFEEGDGINSFEKPTNWEEFKTLISDVKGAGIDDPFVPYASYKKPGLYQWAFEFNLTPNVLAAMAPSLDYDANGVLRDIEVLRGVMEGKFDPTDDDGIAAAVYDEAYNYYKNTLAVHCAGWQSRDYELNWSLGNVAMWDNGLWNIQMENSKTDRDFQYAIFSTPMADASTYTTIVDKFEEGALDIKYHTTKGYENINNPVSVAFNVMKPAVANDPAKLERAIDILMYITAVENNSAMAEEKGGTLGAVQGSGHNALLDDPKIEWSSQYFPVVSYTAKWPTGYTSEMSDKINNDFEKWVMGTSGMDRTKFMKNLKDYQLTGAKQFIQAFNIDTSTWNIQES